MKKLYFVAAAVALAAAGVAIYFAVPGRSLWLPPCMFHELTGLYCPGCGSTRALHRLLHGNPIGALHANPLLLVIGPLLGLVIFHRLRAYLTGSRDYSPNITYPAAMALAVGVVAYWIARNIPAFPFTLLAPH